VIGLLGFKLFWQNWTALRSSNLGNQSIETEQYNA